MKTGKRIILLDRILASPVSVLFIILTLVCISYSNSLKSPPVLDDSASFIEVGKVYLNDFSLESLQQLIGTEFGGRRLLPMFSFALDHLISDSNIVQFHLTNLIIHLLASTALYFFLLGLFRTSVGRGALVFIKPEHFCLFVTALWAMHPVQTNTVTYLVQRMTSMAALFYLTSLAFYVHARLSKVLLNRYILYFGCVFSAICAFLSKENSFMLPFAVLMVEWIFITPDIGRKMGALLKWRYLLPVVLVVLILLPIVIRGLGPQLDYSIRDFTMSERLLTELRVVAFYISLLALPLPGRMNLDHDFSVSSSFLSPPTTLLSFILLGGLLIWAWRLRKKQPLIALGIFWFFLNLVIESTIIPLELIFEHRLYLPSVGFFIAVIAILDRLSASVRQYDRNELQRIVFLGVAIVAIALSLLTTMRNHVWRDKLSLYSDCVKKSPEKPRTLSNYGLALAEKGRYQEAMAMFEKSIAKGRPRYEEFIKAASNIMVILHTLEQYEEAAQRGEDYFSMITIEHNGEGLPKFFYNLGVSYMKNERYSDAMTSFFRGAGLKKPDTHYLIHGMEITLVKAGNEEEWRRKFGLSEDPVDIPLKMAYYMIQLREYGWAKEYINKALGIDPESKFALEIQEKYEQIMEQNKQAGQISDIRNDPVYESNGLFRFYMRLADYIMNNYQLLSGQAGRIIDKADKINSSNLFVAAYKARWYMDHGKYDSALRLLKRAILESPDFPPTLELAGECYRKLDKPREAAIVFSHLLNIYQGHPKWQRYDKLIYGSAGRKTDDKE